MEVTGVIIVLEETQEIGSKGFKKRLVVIETDEQYSQKVGIDFVQDKTSILDNYKIGDSVKVSINIRGNEYNGKYYVNLQGWRIENLEGVQETPLDNLPPANLGSDNEPDDLPF